MQAGTIVHMLQLEGGKEEGGVWSKLLRRGAVNHPYKDIDTWGLFSSLPPVTALLERLKLKGGNHTAQFDFFWRNIETTNGNLESLRWKNTVLCGQKLKAYNEARLGCNNGRINVRWLAAPWQGLIMNNLWYFLENNNLYFYPLFRVEKHGSEGETFFCT